MSPGSGPAREGMVGDDVVYAGTMDGRVVAMNVSSRQELWSSPITTEVSGGLSCGSSTVAAALYGAPVVHGDSVYVGSYMASGGRAYALSIATGQIIREYPIGGAYIGPIVGSFLIEEEVIYLSSSDGRVYALEMPNLTRLWQSEPLADKLWTSPAIAGDSAYVSTFDGRIYALSIETGETSDWVFESEAGFASSPVVYENMVFVGSFDNNLYAIGIGDDEPLWAFSGGKWFWAAPFVYEGIVYAGCLDGRLYALEAESGALLWEFDTGGPIVASPIMMDDLLIVADELGTIHIFDLGAGHETGAVPVTAIPVGKAFKSSFCAAEGFVYVRGEDNRIYVIDVDMGWVSWELALTAGEEG
jgi:eukaryotic-like serine/threonine-protein kinase